MLGLFNKKPDGNADQLRQALSKNSVAIVSASCCMQGTAETDAALESVVRAALDSRALDWPLLTVTVTQAQSSLPAVTRSLDPQGAAVAQQVSDLFMSHGLTAFPVLIVNQQVIAYGGVPHVDLVLKALPASAGPSALAAASGSA